MEENMDIGEFSKITDITIDTLRYYDKIKLLIPTKVNSRRIYTEEDIEKAVIIIKLKKLNFSLMEIKAFFELEKNIEQSEEINDESVKDIENCLMMIEMKYKAIERQEEELRIVKTALSKMIIKTNSLIQNR
jgi:DNA-binding transcriptional MerR regulator